MAKRLRLSHLLLLFIILIGFAPLVLMGFLGHRTTQAMRDDIAYRNLALAQSLAGQVDSLLIRARDQLLELQGNIAHGGLVSAGQIDRYLSSKLTHHPELFNMIMVLDANGLVTNLAPYHFDLLGIDWSNHAAFQQGSAERRPVWSSTFISPRTGSPTMTMSLPLDDGVLVGYLNLAKLSHIAAQIDLGPGGYAAVVDQKGTAIAHTDPTFVDEQRNLKDLSIFSEAVAGHKGVFSFEQNGRPMLGSVALAPLTGWPVVVAQPEDKAFAPVREMSNLTLGSMMIVVLLATMIGLWSIWLVQRPISWLAANAARVAGGDDNFTPPAGKFREFDDLTASFTAMARAIHSREEALRASEEHLRAIVQGSADAIVTMDIQRNITDCNRAFLEQFGFDAQEVIGQSVAMIHSSQASYQTFGAKVYPQVLRDGSWRGEWSFVRKDGEPAPMETAISTLLSPTGKVAGYVALMRDISRRLRDEAERARLEVQLRHSQKMEAIGTLAGGVAHDFNNILQALHGYVQIMTASAGLGEVDRQRLSQMDQALERASSLVRQLLTFSRKVDAELGPVDLNFEVRQSVALLERTIPKMIAIRLDLEPEPRTISANPIQLEQIILNLAANSRDSMPEGGTLTIRTRNLCLEHEKTVSDLALEPGDYMTLCVADTGHGMPPEVIQHIFEPFFTTKGIGGGTGLGLATVYGIVRGHHGAIECQSSPGLGTAITIYFPAAPPTAKAVSPSGPDNAPPPRGNETILLVDDEDSVAEVAQAILEDHGYAVLRAASGEQALELYAARGHFIDLVLLDLGMPGMGGRRALERLLALDQAAKVIIASGYAALDEKAVTIDKGALAYIQKPFRLVEMLRTIRRALDGQDRAV
ncbi:multi-sensor hybrid histidine kinase [Desulfarculus baarsii DSM 2075]|uniref:histidine kinase n=1 Tax=Desulfarculus baarsii (strain ATCC 33931 / DSM 2075 / LMG 7858 / VKM B-1802 / 2st14) TaxID=644282 RepID=E1QEM4_DESB2|nr:ATP-binding protein [Desulfarculus baarsii]ADK84010.1 multi-sensor hybrid histidine kinase [Desulfarculus baarsii DSM 2075]